MNNKILSLAILSLFAISLVSSTSVFDSNCNVNYNMYSYTQHTVNPQMIFLHSQNLVSDTPCCTAPIFNNYNPTFKPQTMLPPRLQTQNIVTPCCTIFL